MSMIYYADKNRKYIGANDHGVEIEGAKYETTKRPPHTDCVLDVENDEWVMPGKAKPTAKPAASKAGAAKKCQGTTKAGKSCKHKATHGNYCRQHMGQGNA